MKKFNWQKTITQETVKDIKKISLSVRPSETISAISYEPDNRILECAVEGQADIIISGDHHLLELENFQGIQIVNPAKFLEIIKAA